MKKYIERLEMEILDMTLQYILYRESQDINYSMKILLVKISGRVMTN